MDPFDQILEVEIRIATLRYHMSALENGERALMQRIHVPLTDIERECLLAIKAQHEKIKAELKELSELVAELTTDEDDCNSDEEDEEVTTRVQTREKVSSDRPVWKIPFDMLSTLSPKVITRSCQKILMRLPRKKKISGLRTIFRRRK